MQRAFRNGPKCPSTLNQSTLVDCLSASSDDTRVITVEEAVKLEVPAILENDIEKHHRLKEFIRRRVRRENGEMLVSSTGTQSPRILRSLSLAQGLIVAHENYCELSKGTKIPVILLDGHDLVQARSGF
jgi:hypothetical protein